MFLCSVFSFKICGESVSSTFLIVSINLSLQDVSQLSIDLSDSPDTITELEHVALSNASLVMNLPLISNGTSLTYAYTYLLWYSKICFNFTMF